MVFDSSDIFFLVLFQHFCCLVFLQVSHSIAKRTDYSLSLGTARDTSLALAERAERASFASAHRSKLSTPSSKSVTGSKTSRDAPRAVRTEDRWNHASHVNHIVRNFSKRAIIVRFPVIYVITDGFDYLKMIFSLFFLLCCHCHRTRQRIQMV